MRALGYISRIFKCTTVSRFQEMSVEYTDHGTKAFPSREDPKVFQGYNTYSSQLYSPEDSHRLERMVQAFISCVTTGNVKVS